MSLSPPLTRQETVLPISASLYSNPLGNAMRALCSSPVTGFLMGSISYSPIPGIRIVAHRFSRSTLISNRGEERLNQIGTDGREDLPVRPAMLTAVESDQRVALLLSGLFVDDRAPHAVALP